MIAAVVLAAGAVVATGEAPTPLYQQFVLVRTGGLFRGVVEPDSGGIRVRRGPDDWVHVPAAEIVATAGSADAIVAARRRTIPTASRPVTDLIIDEIQWCVDQRLASQAAAALFDLHRISPGDARAAGLETQIRDLANPVVAPPPQPQQPPEIQPVVHVESLAPPQRPDQPRRLPKVTPIDSAEIFNRETELVGRWRDWVGGTTGF